jgi:excisionase family DNA binding protein
MTTDKGHFADSSESAKWLSPQDVCNLLQIPRQTFYQWRAKHLGPPASKFGKLIRVNREDFNAWMAGHVETNGLNNPGPGAVKEVR